MSLRDDELAHLRVEVGRLRAELETARKDALAHAAVTLAARLSELKTCGRCPTCGDAEAHAFLAQLHRAAGVEARPA
jgi:hypothetical protein